jgi:ATP-dependent helicase HrpB
MLFNTPLPIDAVLPDLCAALSENTRALLIAPPGAGKTTRVPLALLDAPWRQGRKIIMLSPRRIAARAAADRMAETLGEKAGHTVGYRMRFESKISAATQIEVITEALLTRLILADPELNDIAAILFDEFHERSLDGDIGLALALDVQSALRPDLRILPMSATLETSRISDLLENAPILKSDGKLFPVEMIYTARDARTPLEPEIIRTLQRALREQTGSILVFLPGQAEINRVARGLSEISLGSDVSVHLLMGALELKDQRAAIAPAPLGKRKIVLATSIAETSLTIEGVRVVIDSGLSRRAMFDPNAALNSLITTRASLASATQRAGRAGRLSPGVCYRLWHESENRGLLAYDPPEILNSDLTPMVLTLAAWGVRDFAQLKWIDAPPKGTWQQAVALLTQLNALDNNGALTSHGRALFTLPVHPRLAHMIILAATEGQAILAAEIAALISEPNFGGRDIDLRTRLDNLHRDKSERAQAIRQRAKSWAQTIAPELKSEGTTLENTGALLALAFPDRIAKARGPKGTFLMSNGRAVTMPDTESLSREPWLVVIEASGTADRARILSAAQLTLADIENNSNILLKTEIESRETGQQGNIQFFSVTKLGAIIFSEKAIINPPIEAIHAAWLSSIKRKGLSAINWTDTHQQWQSRIAFLKQRDEAWPDVRDELLIHTAETWLAPYFTGKTKIIQLSSEDIHHALDALLTNEQHRTLAKLAPTRLQTPAGSSHEIDYGASGGPAVECRVQELFGLTTHPCVAGVPLTLILLSPGHKPIQTTKDLPGFWRGSWVSVKSEMRGRYPRHVWPDDPALATPTTRAKPRGT